MKPFIKYTGVLDVQFGEEVTIVEPVNLYGCTIGNHVFIGPFVEVQKNAHVGNHTRIQSHSFICEGVTIGESCFIGHGVMFINDTFCTGGPAGNYGGEWKTTKIGNHVSIGSNASILPVTICDNVVIGAGDVVTKDITEPGFYAGNPARLLKKGINPNI